jgi:hypothetical protein
MEVGGLRLEAKELIAERIETEKIRRLVGGG